MTERLGPHHLKQFISRLIDDESTKNEALALIERYIRTVSADKADLVEGLQLLLDSPEDGKKQANALIERFGKMPKVIFSCVKDSSQGNVDS